ncbi:hypothetical protein COBT_000934 [Conglomerata obtusa]
MDKLIMRLNYFIVILRFVWCNDDVSIGKDDEDKLNAIFKNENIIVKKCNPKSLTDIKNSFRKFQEKVENYVKIYCEQASIQIREFI